MLNDKEIEKLANDKQMISNFIGYKYKRENQKHISYGLNACGYDVRLGNQLKIAIKNNTIADPLDPESIDFMSAILDKDTLDRRYFTLQPGDFALGVAVEKFKIPKNIVGYVINKSTYARCGVDIKTTKINPGWEGDLTLEIENCFDQPKKLYVNQGICTIAFFQINTPEKFYNGKYQKQRGVTSHL